MSVCTERKTAFLLTNEQKKQEKQFGVSKKDGKCLAIK